MAKGDTRKGGYIDKFLKKADKALQEGVRKADEALDEAVEFGSMTVKQASKASKDLKKRAAEERAVLQEKGIKKINEGISSARKAAGGRDDLEILERLGKLRKSGILTDKEFQAKKKEILDRI